MNIDENSIIETVQTSIISVVESFLNNFLPKKRTVSNVNHKKDTTLTVKDAVSVAFKNNGTNTVLINRKPLKESEFESYAVNNSDTIEMTFEIFFEGTGSNDLWITTIK